MGQTWGLSVSLCPILISEEGLQVPLEVTWDKNCKYMLFSK
jgi:hypothetical protein